MGTTIDEHSDGSPSAATGRKVVFCTPCLTRPTQPYLESLAASIPLLHAAGWEEGSVWKVGCPYISSARADLLRKALNAQADVVVFLDYDLSWAPGDLLRLVESAGDVVAGTYCFKRDEEVYMGHLLPGIDGRPQVRADGCVKAMDAPAGFLKITRAAVNKFIAAYPELCYGERHAPHVDLFNHGAHNFVWYGEDYAFCRRWTEKCGEVWIMPDLNLDHHAGERCYPGNFHRFMLRWEGGSEA